MQAHPSLKALVVEVCSLSLVKGAVAGMSKRGKVEKLIVKHGGREPLLVCMQCGLSHNVSVCGFHSKWK